MQQEHMEKLTGIDIKDAFERAGAPAPIPSLGFAASATYDEEKVAEARLRFTANYLQNAGPYLFLGADKPLSTEPLSIDTEAYRVPGLEFESLEISRSERGETLTVRFKGGEVFSATDSLGVTRSL